MPARRRGRADGLSTTPDPPSTPRWRSDIEVIGQAPRFCQATAPRGILREIVGPEGHLVNVHLSEESRRFIADQVAAGRYPSEDAVLEDALARMRRQVSPASDQALENDPLWGMFRDEPELMDQIVRDAMRDRQTVPLRAPGDE